MVVRRDGSEPWRRCWDGLGVVVNLCGFCMVLRLVNINCVAGRGGPLYMSSEAFVIFLRKRVRSNENGAERTIQR